MVSRVRNRLASRRRDRSSDWSSSARAAGASATLLLALAGAGVLAGCGAGAGATADVDSPTPGSCQAIALQALTRIAERVYREGVSSERTVSAVRLIDRSSALRSAVEAGDAAGARAAAQALLATGHMTNVRIVRNGKTLVALGGSAVTPLSGTLTSASGKPIGTFTTSVWSDAGLVAETDGIAEAQAVVQTASGSADAGGRTLAGAFALPSGALPAQGTLTSAGAAYQYASYPATAYPSGAALRVYLIRTVGSLTPLCGASEEDTQFNTISHVAHLIYAAEGGSRTLPQLHRVQGDRALLEAVARRDPQATRAAIVTLLNEHIVRIRVTAGGRVLSDVGGPFVLAPVGGALRVNGRTIGSVVLSIQDDEGYKRLAARLAGLDVVMYMGQRLVKSTIGSSPGAVPTSGTYTHGGKSYRAYTFYGTAFPSGPLRITDLIPMPYT